MEATVRINQAWIKDVQRFLLRCRVQAAGSGEAHEGSVSINQQPQVAFRHEFAFTFVSRPSQLSLLFVTTSPRHETTTSPRRERELGRSAGTLNMAESGLERTRTLFLSQPVPDTKVERFVGKVTYIVRLKDTGGANLASLLSDEAKRACGHVLPSESPFVSVVFHCAPAGMDPTRELVGVARIGDRSDVSVSTLLQENSPQPSLLPILKPVKLYCQEFDCLELHVADSKSGIVHFSSSRALSRLTPLKPIHLNQIRGAQGDTQLGPTVSISALYTPSASQYSRFEGLEVAVCKLNLPRGMHQCRDVVMGVQLVQANSKGKTPTLGGHSLRPPFYPPIKKGGSPGSDPEYHISVLQYQRKELNRDSVVKSYYFFQEPLLKPEGLYLLFHIYSSSGTQLWWDTDNHILARLEISEETLTSLQKGEPPLLNWSTSNNDSLQPSSLFGVLCWKSRKAKFLSDVSVREVFAQVTSPARALGHHPRNEPNVNVQRSPNPCRELPPQPSDPVLFRQESETPEESDDTGDMDVVRHLTEFETTICKMAGDFRALRRENRRLQADNEQLVQEMAELRSLVGTSSSLTDGALRGLSKSDLTLRVKSLQQSIEAEKKTREHYQEKNRALQSDLSALQELETSYIELREVHREQQKLIQTLKGKVAKYYKCSDICRKQESVITQLESLLAKQAQGHPSAKDDAISLLGRENAQLRTFLQQSQTSGDHSSSQRAALVEKDQTIQSLKSQLSQLVSRCRDLERRSGGSGGAVPEERRELEVQVFELQQKLLVAEAKLSAQSTQLQENAEKWMKEKARYELQLAEYRSRLDTVVRSGQQALLANTPPVQEEPAASSSDAQRGTEKKKKGGGQKYSSVKTSKKEFSF